MFASTDNHTSVGGQVVNNPFEVKKQPIQCRDPIFAVLFYANLAAIIGLAVVYGQNPFKVDTNEAAAQNNQAATDDQFADLDYSPFLYSAGIAGGVGLVLSCIGLQVLMCIPGILIKASLLCNIALGVLAVAAGFYYNQMVMAIFAAVFLLLTICYTYCIWSRIPFATANLKTGSAAVRANCGVSILAYIVVVFAFAWTILWTTSVVGVQDQLITCTTDEQTGQTICQNPNYFYFFLLFVSYFFTHQVLQNTIHTTIAGVVGTWWFIPDESGFCGKAVCGSFFRTLTTSFGSVCFGSLLVALIEATRQIIYMMRDNEDIGPFIACCIDCVLGCIEGLVEYFNKWAYVYVGLYGFSYCEAGKNVIQLFKNRGWEAVIADDIVGTVLAFLSLFVGLITCGVSLLTVSQTNWYDSMIEAFEGDALFAQILAGIIGFIIGFALCSIIMGVISSSVNAVIVLFAEAPSEFENHYPELSREMREAYMLAHPGCL